LFSATVLENSGYCFSIDRVRLKNNKIEILNGPYTWTFFNKEENEVVKYGLGSFTDEKVVVEKRKRAHNLCEEVQPRIETLAAAGS